MKADDKKLKEVKDMEFQLQSISVKGNWKKRNIKMVSRNPKLFFTILDYSEQKLYDQGLVLKLCNHLTGWIDYYMYRLNNEIYWNYDGLALNYYLRSNGFLEIVNLFMYSKTFYSMYTIMLEEVQKLGITKYEYMQIGDLVNELIEMTPDKWGTTEDVFKFLKNI